MRFLAKFFRHWVLYLLVLIIMPMLVMAYGYQKLAVYESTALLFVNKPNALNGSDPTTFNQYLSPAQNGANAMNEALLSEKFVVSIAAATNLANVYDLNSQTGQDEVSNRLRQEIIITPTTVGQNTLTVSVDDKNPQLAQQIATAVLRQFTLYFSQSQLSLDTQREAFLQQQLQDAQAKVVQDQAHITQYLQQHPNESPNSRLNDPALNSLNQQYTSDQNTVT